MVSGHFFLSIDQVGHDRGQLGQDLHRPSTTSEKTSCNCADSDIHRLSHGGSTPIDRGVLPLSGIVSTFRATSTGTNRRGAAGAVVSCGFSLIYRGDFDAVDSNPDRNLLTGISGSSYLPRASMIRPSRQALARSIERIGRRRRAGCLRFRMAQLWRFGCKRRGGAVRSCRNSAAQGRLAIDQGCLYSSSHDAQL